MDPASPDGLPRRWEIEFFQTDEGEKPVLDWIKRDLTPTKRRALGTAMRRVLQVHGPGVQSSSWGRPVATGIFEFRLRMKGKEVVNLEAEIHHISNEEALERFGLDPSEQLLLRVFCTVRVGKVILLLNGYDKGVAPADKRQQAEIREAERRLRLVERREAQARKAARRGPGAKT